MADAAYDAGSLRQGMAVKNKPRTRGASWGS
jgi:hypothetical protein